MCAYDSKSLARKETGVPCYLLFALTGQET